MNAADHKETRAMISDVLTPWLKASEDREKNIYLALNNIDRHLDKLNGKVSEHEKTILQNLPHTADHCAKANVIDEMHDAIIEYKGAAKQKLKTGTHKQATFNNVFTIISTLLVLAGLIITFILGNRADEALNEKIDNFGTPVIINSRGEITRLPIGDSLKFYRDGSYNSTYTDSIK